MRAKNISYRPTAKALVWLVAYLADVGVIAPPTAAVAASGQEALVERYRDYLVVEGGLEPVTVDNDVRAVRLFLTAQHGRGLAELSAADVAGFDDKRAGQQTCDGVSGGEPLLSRGIVIYRA